MQNNYRSHRLGEKRQQPLERACQSPSWWAVGLEGGWGAPFLPQSPLPDCWVLGSLRHQVAPHLGVEPATAAQADLCSPALPFRDGEAGSASQLNLPALARRGGASPPNSAAGLRGLFPEGTPRASCQPGGCMTHFPEVALS